MLLILFSFKLSKCNSEENARSLLCIHVMQDWQQSTSIARAFSIGKAESEAVSVIMSAVAPEIVGELESAVKARGMQSFMLHEVISKGIFSNSWTSGYAEREAWADVLRNRDDLLLVHRFQNQDGFSLLYFLIP